MKYNMPLILFAGGKSSRMGKDKALLPFGTCNTLAEFQYKRMQHTFKDIFISTKEDKFDFDAPLIEDRYEAYSPLVAITSVFETLKDEEEVFILSVDTPFVDEKIIAALMEHKEAYDVVIARTASGKQPLCGIYKRSILPFAKENLKQDRHKIGLLLNAVKTNTLFFEEDEAFANLNYLHEYEQALSSSRLTSEPSIS